MSPRAAETLAADQDVRARLRACGPDALTSVEALTILLAILAVGETQPLC
jgi:DNA repair protein RadC